MPQKPRLGPDRRTALGILADAPHGLTEEILLAHGAFDSTTLASLISDGLATAKSDVRRGRRFKITEAGRRRLEAE
jgi:hypothetical protein